MGDGFVMPCRPKVGASLDRRSPPTGARALEDVDTGTDSETSTGSGDLGGAEPYEDVDISGAN